MALSPVPYEPQAPCQAPPRVLPFLPPPCSFMILVRKTWAKSGTGFRWGAAAGVHPACWRDTLTMSTDHSTWPLGARRSSGAHGLAMRGWSAGASGASGAAQGHPPWTAHHCPPCSCLFFTPARSLRARAARSLLSSPIRPSCCLMLQLRLPLLLLPLGLLLPHTHGRGSDGQQALDAHL